MLKTLTLSLSLAVALGFCSVSRAGSGCSTCGLASAQGPAPSPQASPQGVYETCAPAPHKCCLKDKLAMAGNKMSCDFKSFCAKMKPKPPVYTYEWVLKKKRVWCHKSNPCGAPACETCAPMASEQGYASPQAGPASPQAFGTYSPYGSGQAYAAPSYGSGQLYAAPTSGTMAAPHPAGAGDEAPLAPEVAPPATPGMPATTPGAPSIPAAPAPPAVPAAPAPPATSGLLFSTPSGN